MRIIPFYMEDITLNASKNQASEVLRFDGFVKNGRAFLRFIKIMALGRIFYIDKDFSTPYFIKKMGKNVQDSFSYEIERADGQSVEIEKLKKNKKLIFIGSFK